MGGILTHKNEKERYYDLNGEINGAGKLDSLMQKNKTRPLSYAIPKN